MFKGKNRSYLIGIVGGYLMYLAYQLFEGRNDPESTMPLAVNIAFVAFFVLAGIGLMIYAYRIWKIADRDEREGKTEPLPEDKNAMK